MVSFKTPTFAERQTAAAEARQKALEKMKARTPVDEAVLAARREAAEKREAAAAEKRAARKAAVEEAKAAAAAKAAIPVLTEAERKAERDRRYAQRKARK